MGKIYFVLSILLTSSILQAQTREKLITGQLKSTEDGQPIPGVNVVIKGTTTGTITGADGSYSLRAPVGSILQFSFIGMQTRELLVTDDGLKSLTGNFQVRSKEKPKWNPSIIQDTTSDKEGVTTLRSKMPSYRVIGSGFAPSTLFNLKKHSLLGSLFFRHPRENYVVTTNSERYISKGFHIQFNNSITVEKAGKLPALQSTYAQGQNTNGTLTWNGPDQQEVMSWGPALKTLEYTGYNYAYDRNGTITTAGNGNGKSVGGYDPYQFFAKGITTGNEINTLFAGFKGSTARLDWNGKLMRGVIPGNTSNTNNFFFSMKKIRIAEKLTSDVLVQYSLSQGKLMNRGANMSNLMGSVMRTPVTFDNANGFSNKTASENLSVYRLPDGSVRSAAPGYIDNPYGLINELPDNEKVSRIVSSLAFTYYSGHKIDFNVSGSYDKQRSQIVNGIFPGLSGYVAGRRTERTEEKTNKGVNFNLNLRLPSSNASFFLTFGYQFQQEQRDVNRKDGFRLTEQNYANVNLADSLKPVNLSLGRNIHETQVKIKYDSWIVDFQLGNRNYFSNTLDPKKYVNLFPFFSVQSNLANQLYLELSELRPFVSASRTIREAPLLFGSNSFLSTNLSSSAYNAYFENREIAWNNQLKPETEIKLEGGLSVRPYFDMQLEVAFYNNTTYGLILPTWNGNQVQLQNAATVNNSGVNAALSYNNRDYSNTVSWGASLRWTKYNSMVTSLDIPGDYLPLAGFKEIQTVVAKNQPLGAIYGTTFLRDDKGRVVIGNDGFPSVNSQMKRIGNPIPDFVLSFEPYISVKQRLKFAFIVDFKRGGQVWNGTKAALNYFGRSQESAEQRTLANYIFDGVNANGVTNTTPVSFYDPTLSLSQNRWVRYGFSGVGEEHIENGSWIRLNEISLTYKFFPRLVNTKKELALSFVGKNLFLITPYSGVDPGTALYGYGTGRGLDLFNSPSLKTYHFQITLKI